MPRKKKPNYGYNAGFLVPEVALDTDDIEALEDICDEPGFIEAVTGAIGWFRGHKINELESSTVSEQRAALLELESLTDGLCRAIDHLDSDTEEKILQALNYESHEFLHSLASSHLRKLSAGVELARRAIEGDTGAPAKESERVFVAMLADIFNQHEIEIGTEDISITGTGFYQALYIGLREGWPTEAEWPEKRKYALPRESTIVALIKEYLP